MMQGPCCLLVEDQALIGMALEASLEEAGFDIAGMVASNAAALRYVVDHTPDLVLLDVMLKDGPALAVSRELKRRGIAFAIYSGLTPEPRTPEFHGVPWLEKPVSRAALAQVLTEHLGRLGAPVPTWSGSMTADF